MADLSHAYLVGANLRGAVLSVQALGWPTSHAARQAQLNHATLAHAKSVGLRRSACIPGEQDLPREFWARPNSSDLSQALTCGMRPAGRHHGPGQPAARGCRRRRKLSGHPSDKSWMPSRWCRFPRGTGRRHFDPPDVSDVNWGADPAGACTSLTASTPLGRQDSECELRAQAQSTGDAHFASGAEELTQQQIEAVVKGRTELACLMQTRQG